MEKLISPLLLSGKLLLNGFEGTDFPPLEQYPSPAGVRTGN
jgi:hypothetical protein